MNAKVDALALLVAHLQQQLADAEHANTPRAAVAAPASPPTTAKMPSDSPPTEGSDVKQPSGALDGMTINATFDGYYEYNLNSPLGRVNTLRAYDVSSNSFSLNQAALVIERLPDTATEQHLGLRLDLQFGQATSTLQGNPTNELRPAVYRNVFQAYGTYVIPLASGLAVDFGKWASSLGLEGNYTKDQLNYSRSFWFDYLPFYHTGVRAKLALNDAFAINLWVTNGTQQTEAFNNYKDQLLGFVLMPNPQLTWTVNYYRGQEHPDVSYVTSPTPQQLALPNQQGTYIAPVANAPDGKLEIIDTYLTWQLSKQLEAAVEADYVQERLYSYSVPDRVMGGAVYAAYTLSERISIAARAEYLADIGGLFSGANQYLKEETLTFDYHPADGFLLRGEYRRDQSNRRFFYSSQVGLLEHAQPTIGIGAIWWIGGKKGPW